MMKQVMGEQELRGKRMAGAGRHRRVWQEQEDVGDGRTGALGEEYGRSRTTSVIGEEDISSSTTAAMGKRSVGAEPPMCL